MAGSNESPEGDDGVDIHPATRFAGDPPKGSDADSGDETTTNTDSKPNDTDSKPNGAESGESSDDSGETTAAASTEEPAASTGDEEAAEKPPEGVRDPREPDTDDADQDVFRNVYGHEGAKAVVGAALRDGDVHILLDGPPGSGKSVFLMALESNVPGCVYRDGDQITPSKLRDVLKEDPAILLIDEIDALSSDGYDVLSLPMEHGRLVRDSARESYDVEVGTQIVAASNDKSAIQENILNRFQEIEFEEYDETEFFDLCEKMLVDDIEWVETAEQGRAIGKMVYKSTGKADPRKTRDIASMANSMDEIDALSKAMLNPGSNDMESKPLRVDEVARAQGDVGKQNLKKLLTDELLQQRSTMDDANVTSDGGESGVDSENISDEIGAAVEAAVSESD